MFSFDLFMGDNFIKLQLISCTLLLCLDLTLPQYWVILIFWKILLGIPSECQTVCIRIRPDIPSGLIWIQTVCKGYLQMTLVGHYLLPADIESWINAESMLFRCHNRESTSIQHYFNNVGPLSSHFYSSHNSIIHTEEIHMKQTVPFMR